MAVFLAPVAAGVVGGSYLLLFTKANTAAANYTAKSFQGCSKDPYDWPFWKAWGTSATPKQSTLKGNVGTLVLFGASFWLQRRLIWRHIGNRLQTPGASGQKIKSTKEFATVMGPSVVENSLNGFCSSAIAGAARPFLDNVQP